MGKIFQAKPGILLKGQEDVPDYEQVNVRSTAAGKRSRRRPMNPQEKFRVQEALITRKWLLIIAGMGTLMLGLGALAGFGLYVMIYGEEEVADPDFGWDKGGSVGVFCRRNYENQECVFEVPAKKGDKCESLCKVEEWRIKVEGSDRDIISFERVKPEPLPLKKIEIPVDTECGVDLTCDAKGECSKYKNGTQYDKTSSPVGRWIYVDQTRADFSLPCLNFSRKTDDGKPANEIWDRMFQMLECNKTKAEEHCDNYTGVASIAVAIQFRYCDYTDAPRFKCDDGSLLHLKVCNDCSAAVDQEKMNTSKYVNETCRPTGGSIDVENCRINCHGGKIAPLPDGTYCEGKDGNSYCFMGNCYELAYDFEEEDDDESCPISKTSDSLTIKIR